MYDRVNKCTKDCTDQLFVRDMPSNCLKHKPDAWCMAGDIFFSSRNDRFRQIEIKFEIIMEKRMHDTCQHKYGL